MNFWERFLAIDHLGDFLSMTGLLLTFVGFTATLLTAIKAKRAAEAARAAAESATREVRKVDLIGEVATMLQLIEELRRLQRANAVELLPDRYSGLRSKMVSIRESMFFSAEEDQTIIQDVIARIAALQKALDRDSETLNDRRQIARSNESLSVCTDVLLRLSERVRNYSTVII
jgi:hypothetical protein